MIHAPRFLLTLGVFLALAFSSGADAQRRFQIDRGAVFPLTLSGDGTYLASPNGSPFLITGQSSWPLYVQPSLADAKLYIERRLQLGYNTLLTNFDKTAADTAPSNFAGNPPFSTPGDFTTPNAAYFNHVATVITYARSRGVLMLVAPMYLGFGGGDWEVEVNAQSAAVIEGYGNFIGTRFKGLPNIIWVMGGDTNPGTSVKNKVSDFVTGLKAAGDTHLITAHGPRNSDSRDVYPSVSWLDINAIYTDGTSGPTEAADGYTKSPAKPNFLIEDWYTNEHGYTVGSLEVRREGWWALFTGATLGQLTGECPSQFQGAAATAGFCDAQGRDWKVQLTSTSALDRARIGHLLRSRRFHLLIPDAGHTTTTAGYSSGTNLVTTTRASDGSSVLAYCPTGSTVTITVDMTKIAGTTARCWWFNPRSGATTSIGDFATTGTRNFTPPDGNDWVLDCDNVAVYTAAPGNGQ